MTVINLFSRFADLLVVIEDRHPEIIRELARLRVNDCPHCGCNEQRAIDRAEEMRHPQLSFPFGDDY